MSVSVAIIGSGPSAFYTADALVKSDRDCTIDIIERLPAPFGLIRYGVAPDHQTTKNVVRNFDRTAQKDEVKYFGNIDVGTDISLDDVRACYDAVVLATGAPNDNPLNIKGDDKAGVIGSAAFVGWYNGHPDFRDLNPDLGCDSVVVIGNGNVAIDIARLLVKTPTELAGSDISYAAADAFAGSAVRDVYMVGRRGPLDAKFTNVELREMGELEICSPVLSAAQLPDEVPDLGDKREQRLKERNLATLKGFLDVDQGRNRRVHFQFYASPVEFLGDDRVEAVRFEKTAVVDGRALGSGEFFEIPCGLVLPAIGYRTPTIASVPFDEDRGRVINDDCRVADGLYVVGWAMRGPTGVIATNRPDGKTAAEHILNDISEPTKPGRAAFIDKLDKADFTVVDYDDWLKIDEQERHRATDPSPRRKFITVSEMLDVLSD